MERQSDFLDREKLKHQVLISFFESIAWLNQFADRPLNDHQRLALAYLHHHDHITNSDYQRLNHVDSVTANRELHSLVQLKLVDQHGTRRWAYYTLKISIEVKVEVPPQTDEEKILAYVKKYGSIDNSKCRDLLHVNMQRSSYLLKKMYKRGLLKRDGKRRWVVYRLL